jgi:hypothetical protein
MAAKPTPKPKKSDIQKAFAVIKKVPKNTNLPAKVTPKPTGKLVGPAAVKQYQKDVSPKGVAARDAAIQKALEEKYPGMFVLKTRTTTMIPGR